jgi:hypothetical protein
MRPSITRLRTPIFMLTVSALTASCGLSPDSRIQAAGSQPDAALESQTFTASGRLDLLFAVDSATLTADQQRQVDASIQQILDRLNREGVDFQIGFVKPAQSQSAGAPANIGDLLGASNGQGAYINALLPIVSSIAQQGSGGASLQTILNQIAPLVFNGVNQGAIPGQYNTVLQQFVPLIQMALQGQGQGQSFQNILANILPLALNIGLSSAGGGQYAQIASVLMPTILNLVQNGGQNANFGTLLSQVLPLVLSQVGGGNSQTNQIVSLITPLITGFLSGSSQAQNPQQILSSLLPVAMNLIQSSGGNSQYTQLISTVMPMVLGLLSNQNVAQKPEVLASAVVSQGLAAVLSAVSKDKGSNAFLRPEALLNVIMIGDKYGSGSQNPQATALNFMQGLVAAKGGKSGLVAFDAILGGGNSACQVSSASGVVSSSIFSQVAKFAGGQVADFCSQQGSALDSLADTLIDRVTGFKLASPALADSIQVLVNGAAVPQGASSGWSLSQDAQIVRLKGSYVPTAGSEVVVRYVPRS